MYNLWQEIEIRNVSTPLQHFLRWIENCAANLPQVIHGTVVLHYFSLLRNKKIILTLEK